MADYREHTTVRDLIEELQKFPPDMQIGMASDEEGNEYYKDFYPETEGNVCIIYPGGARMDIDEFRDYEFNEEDED